jgi:hypothetical protein
MRKTHVIDGVTYVAVDRAAKIGDKVLIVEAWNTHGKYDNGSVIDVQRLDGKGIENDAVSARNNETGFISSDEYVVLEPLESEEATVDGTQASPAVIEMFTALSRKIVSLERQLADTQRNLETFAEQTENNSEDIRTLDSRTQVINAITKFYEEGRR